jgi:hypothetical protein
MTVAEYVPARPAICTVMLVAPDTTWLFVRTSPVEVRMIPVPAAVPDPLAVWNTLLISTTAGSTVVAIAEA